MVQLIENKNDFSLWRAGLLEDNYAFVIHHESSGWTAIVDPSESEALEAFLEAKAWRLDVILNTHHHHDHVGGNERLAKRFGAEVICSSSDLARVPAASRGLSDGESVGHGELHLRAISIPGHTLGHTAYYAKEFGWLFCGDTLFGMGCGRLFEGTPEMMFSSLGKLKSLPEATLVCCGHEYTAKNATFALGVSPKSAEVKNRAAKVTEQRQKNEATVPFSLREDLTTNPFLLAASVEEFARLREMRNSF